MTHVMHGCERSNLNEKVKSKEKHHVAEDWATGKGKRIHACGYLQGKH